MAMIIVIAIRGWNLCDGILKFVFAIGIPALMADSWGIFAVKGDPSRSGKAIVQTPGIVRLFMEFLFFAFFCWVIYAQEYLKLSSTITILSSILCFFN